MYYLKQILISVLFFSFASCAGNGGIALNNKHKIELSITGPETVNIRESSKDRTVRSITVENPEGSLSSMSFIIKNEAYMKVFSSITVHDAANVWNDFCYLKNATNIRKVHVFINSPGGSASAGMNIVNEIEKAKRNGFEVNIYASGIVASAAVPILASGTKGHRYAGSGTMFMVHETALWKWPGMETHSNIKTQAVMMDKMRAIYLGTLAKYTNLTEEEWGAKEGKTTWFTVKKAKEWGLIDHIE